MQIHVCYVCVKYLEYFKSLEKIGHFAGFHQIGYHENFIFTKKVARQPYFFLIFSNSPLYSATDEKRHFYERSIIVGICSIWIKPTILHWEFALIPVNGSVHVNAEVSKRCCGQECGYGFLYGQWITGIIL